MRKVLIVAVCIMLAFGVYLTYSTVDTKAPVASADGKGFSGTIYVAGMGGHFAVADIVVDPGNHANPIKVKNLDRIVLGTKKTHPVHDPRIDVNDRNKMFWSTYKIDKTQEGRAAHIGVVDLKTKKVVMDKVVQLDERAKFTGALYCGSGQTANSYIPTTMTGEAYIDVYNKSDLSLKERVFFKKKDYDQDYLFLHGTNSPDMKTFVVTFNKTEKWPAADKPGKPTGEVDMMLLDLAKLEKGKIKILAKNRVTGQPGKTLTFRMDFTPDGKYIMQSAADRMYLLDGKTLGLLDEEIMKNGNANHDIVSGPNGKYAILTIRNKVSNPAEQGKSITDGSLLLYDIEARTVIGKPVSVCQSCHQKMGLSGSTVLCGADANWN